MEVQFGPNAVDEPNLQYKLQRKIKVFNTTNPLPNRGYNLVTSATKYGLVFIGSPDGTLSVYYLQQLIDKECEPKHLTVKLQEKPTHIAVNSDNELLAVTGGQLLSIFRVADFQNQNVAPALTVKCDVQPSTFVSALQWNPCVPDTIAIAFFDGVLLMCQANTAQVKKVQSKARCICWSPKGKQLVTGNSDGTLTQYKPDLTPAKNIPPPNLFEGAPVEALAVYWISTFQFAVVYKNAADNSRPGVTIVNTPKAGQPSCLNYEDICYSMGSNRPWYYYLQGIAQWNMILLSSSNSMEIATLSTQDGANWLQWCQTDEARPELPLTDKKQENYPVGITIDTCAIHQLPWGENELLPHMPLLHVVSHSGLLTLFNIINLNKALPQVCTPPQQLTLPAAALTSNIPGEAPAPVQPPAPAIVQPKPQAFTQVPQQIQQPIAQHAQPVQPPPQPNPPSMFGAPNVTKLPSFQQVQNQVVAPTPQVAEQKQPEVKPAAPQPQAAPVQPKPATTQAPKPQPSAQAQEASAAALKAEQERANQELKNMLIKEVNDFQMELYKFAVKTRETQIKLQRDIDTINANFNFQSLDTEQLRKDCSLEELRGAIAQLKLELVRACAVVAEARAHSDAKDLHQWTQADPLTTKRVASVKKLAYYVQNQLDQAQKALDYKWNEIANRNPQYNKPGQRMIRPILDDVYQPLVKQQEILSRQQAVLRTLRNTLNECDAAPLFKSTSLLRSTPFRNKDPLSKLTKNILNMSIEPQEKTKESIFTAQKLDALRDMLSNHTTVKIKPINVELRQHLASMRLNYEKSLKEKAAQPTVPKVTVKVEPEVKYSPQPVQPPVNIVSSVPKPDVVKQVPITVPSFTPVGNAKMTVPGLANVARTLFTDEPEPPKPTPFSQPASQPSMTPKQAFAFTPAPVTATTNTRSVLKDLLQNKQANIEAKNDANTFMGQKICSPASFAFSSVPIVTAAPTAIYTSKPISDISNMFNKFQPQVSNPPTETKPQIITTKVKHDETGEVEIKPVETKKDVKITNLFGMKTSTPIATATSVPDVLKSNKDITPIKAESKNTIKPIEKLVEKLKENVTEKATEKEQKPPSENVPKIEPTTEIKTEAPKAVIKTEPPTPTTTSATSSASSIFAAANTGSTASKPTSVFGAPTTQSSIFASTTQSEKPTDLTKPAFGATTSASASSIFGKAVASQPSTEKTTALTGSLFSATATTASSSLFSSTSTSVFGFTTTTGSSVFGNTAQSVFSSANKPSVFSTPTPASPTPAAPTPVTPTPVTPTPVSPTPVTPAPTSPTPVTPTPVTPTPASVFGSAATTTSQPSTTTAASSVFSSSSTTSIFGASSTPSSVFATTTSSQGSIFSSSTAQSVFGSATSTTSASVFSTTTTTQPSVFSTTTATTQSIFGSTPSPAQSVFGTAATSQPSSSIFGSTTTTAQSVFGTSTSTTQPSIFGGAATTSQSVFGSTTTTTQASVFGASTQASVFGSPTATNQTSVFGSTPAQPSVFGTPTSTPSVFGSPSQTTQASIFGTPTQTTQASVFGSAPAATDNSGSLFGGSEANLFASASISTTSAPSQTSGGSIFGGSSSGSVFGGGSSNVFGGKAAFSQSNPSAAAIFGGGAAFSQKPATNFWAGGNNSGGTGFGSTGFGQQATTQASSIFGGTTGGSFSAPSGGAQPFGSPQGSAFGGGDAKPSVFGSPQQQGATAFGGSPVFGNKPVFGQSAGFGSPTAGSGFGSSFGGFNKSPSSGFGSPAAFGGAPTFGGTAFGGTSPSKVFGNAAPTAGFGSPTQSNATFESLATQNTLTFGNLAQTAQQAPAQPTFNTSPSFTGWRG